MTTAADTGKGRSVVVTGASTGIGRSTAIALDAQGFHVFAGIRRPEDGHALQSETSERLTPIRLDVTEAESIASAVERVADAVGESGVWGLVNNAGIALADVQEFIDLKRLRRQLEVNVIGCVAVTRSVLPLIRKAQGRIVQMGSTSGYLASPFLGPYCASKFALEAITDCLRRELRPWSIEVAIIQPGAIDTPIWEKAKPLADTLRKALPPEGLELYGDTIEAMMRYVNETARAAIPAHAVVRAVLHALTARRPRTRYRVGIDARVNHWLARWLPDRLLDAVIARGMRRG